MHYLCEAVDELVVPGQLRRNESPERWVLFSCDDLSSEASHRVVWVVQAESELVVEAVAVRALWVTAIAMGEMV